MGLSVDELFTLVGATADDGPMFGEAGDRARAGRSEIGETYTISGGITGVVRKEGRKAGVFDIVTFRLELADDDGALAARLDQLVHLPEAGLMAVGRAGRHGGPAARRSSPSRRSG